MKGNRTKRIKMSKPKLENVVEKGLKSNTWTRPHNPSGPHDESKRGGPSLDKLHALLACAKGSLGSPISVSSRMPSFSFKFPPL